MQTPHAPALSGIANWRDIGGLRTEDGRTVAHGLLFRSGHLGKATAEDLDALRRLGVRLVVDLRAELEAQDEGIAVPEGAERLAFGLPPSRSYLQMREFLVRGDYPGLLASLGGVGDHEAALAAHMAGFYVEMTADPDGVFAATLARIAEPQGTPALVHCSAGKDRTGWTVALVLLALGVPEEDVLDEYLLSNGAVERAVGVDPRIAEAFGPVMGVRAEYLTGALDHVRRSHGSVDGYLRDVLGVDEALRGALRARLLD
ncbi:tyrosine-protein phosphatase [Yinghuangia seranimata]|uniref:tyrosine-protein phosphatase n=1 Tax=Yinghuangia seranimata TaxID=408067 RepID=UPI00248C0C2B|nr:tyrosine-protein phosphatase [Yinghuangia seranimata]MDI2125668.1 tyrosine-protein phosphatase [Yinghuangia seranimata]